MESQPESAAGSPLLQPGLWAGLALAGLAGWMTWTLPALWRFGYPLLLPLALPLGQILLGASYALTSRSLRRGAMLVRYSYQLYLPPARLAAILACLITALTEEMLFRAAPLGAFPDAPWLALPVSAVYALAHIRSRRQIRPWPLLDLFCFGLIQSALYLALDDLCFVVLVHAVRNYGRQRLFAPKEEVARRLAEAEAAAAAPRSSARPG